MRFFRFLWGWWGSPVPPPRPAAPFERTFRVALETRVCGVERELRVYPVAQESRIYVV
jgi:hypothetical protein